VRNALINNFNQLDLRNDVGEIWENYLFVERLKRQEYLLESANNYFWRTYSKKEVDLVEERGGKLHRYEIKWGKAKPRPPKEWATAYPEALWEMINRDNYLGFITTTA
jgi:predicted AAA+ superfamily ATPase